MGLCGEVVETWFATDEARVRPRQL
jgi:hypothetical protein